MAAAWNDVPATGGLDECTALVRSAEALRTSAPELSVQLARRALLVGASDLTTTASTGEARSLTMRAQAVLAAGLVRISQHASAVEPGFAALALAESGGALVLSAELRLDLAECAQDVGEPLLGGALLRPVLEAGQAPPSVRAAALGRLVGCVAHVARRDDVEDALAEADRLLAADDGLSPDARRMERARLAVRSAAYHRWYGDNEDAVTAARDGLMLIDRLRRELRSESDRLRTRLVLELVCALLDEGELWEAEEAAHPTVDQPVRATSAASVGQLMLAVATRVHLPSGEVDRGRGLLAQAAWLAERHGQDSVLADALTELSRLDEQAGRVTDALEALRSARAAEQRRMRAMARAARHMLVQVAAAHGGKDVTQQAAALLRQLAHPQGVPVAVAPPPTKRTALPPPRTSQEPQTPPPAENTPDHTTKDKDTGLLDREGLFRKLSSVRKVDRPVALTLVRFEPNKDNTDPDTEDRGPDTGIMVGLADKVRDMAPEDAEVARSDGGELAVLLPHTTRDQAEEFAATIRETAMESDWLADGSGKDMSISTGVVQSDPQPNTQVDAASLLTAARDALTPAPTTPTPPTDRPEPATSLDDTKAALSTALSKPRETPPSALTEDPPTTPLNVATTSDPRTAGRSILNSLSIPSGSGGRRRAPGGEPAPGERTSRPTEPAEAPRWAPADLHSSTPPPPAPGFTTSATPGATNPADFATGLTTPADAETPRWAPTDLHPSTPPPPAPGFTTSATPDATDPADFGSGLTPAGTGSSNAADFGSGSIASAGPGSTDPADFGSGLATPADAGTPRWAPADFRSTSVDPGPTAPAAPSLTNSADFGSGPTTSAGPGPIDPADFGSGPTASAGPGLTTPADLGSGLNNPAGSGFTTPAELGSGPIDPAEHGLAGQAVSSTSAPEPSGWPAEPDISQPLRPPAASKAPSTYDETRAELARMMSVLNAKARRNRTNTDDTSNAPTGYEAADLPPAPQDTSPAEGDLRSGQAAATGRPLSAYSSFTQEQAQSPVPGAEHGGTTSSSPAQYPATDPAATETPSFGGGHGFATQHGAAAGPVEDSTAGAVGQYSAAELYGPASTFERFSAEPVADQFASGEQFDIAALADLLASRQSIPTPPEPREMPEPPGGPDIPEPPSRPDIPEPPEPDLVPPAPPERPPASPPEPEPGTDTRSRLMAAFDALTGPVPGAAGASDEPRPEEPGEKPGFRVDFASGNELPSRRPLRSWSELESASVVESPADGLFGAAAAEDRPKASLGDAFGDFSATEEEPAGLSAVFEHRTSAGFVGDGSGEKPSVAPREPSGASAGLSATTYDHPIGPERRPEGLPRRGERSATTIASLLTEALAAYQATADDEDGGEPPAHDHRDAAAGDPNPAAGRHRSPE